jgi:hypothetical protein
MHMRRKIRISSPAIKEGLSKIINTARQEAKQEMHDRLMQAVDQRERRGRKTITKQELQQLLLETVRS